MKQVTDRLRAEKRADDHRYAARLLRNPKAELFLYNTKTGRDYTIRTGDIESEVLLVEDDVVYYRVKNRLYRSAIRQGQAGEPELLGENEALSSVYWAFTGPVCEAVKKQGQK